MGGISTFQRIAVLEMKSGISIDTYESQEALLMAQAYRYVAENRGDTEKLQKLIDDVIKQADADWRSEGDAP